MTTTQQQEMNTMTTTPTELTRTSGTDVSNFGDYSNMTIKGADGKEITVKLYGR